MGSEDRTWGITPPISVQLPSPSELEYSNKLLEELRAQGTFETPEESALRDRVLTDLKRIVNEFVRRIAKKREPHNARLVQDARGQVFTYGSYCLGVYGPGSDIDTLVCVPRYVTREDYFEYFPEILREMTPKDAVTDLTPVEEAFVPIIKFEYWNISIDLIFSRIATLKQFPPEGDLMLTDNQYLRGLDDAELRSVNGTRVTNEILDLVPEKNTFRLALRAIKLWAQRRAIYANIIGFPGGVVWAMLVARVCQLYPRAASATIVAKFFHIINKWPWPQPVLLKHMEDGPLNVRVWNPKIYKGDAFHLMPVITPAYPQMCATFNITKSNKSIIQRELARAGELADRIMTNRAGWKELFVRHTFFTKGYRYYLAVVVTSRDKEAHKIWSGFVESKIRVLVGSVERHPSIKLAHPFNKGFERRHKLKNADEFRAVVDGSLVYLCNDADVHSPEPTPVKQENASNEPANGTSNGVAGDGLVKAEQSSTPVLKAGLKSDPEDEKLKLADIPAAPAPAPSPSPTLASTGEKVYTTTHYIGLELTEGAKSLDLSFQVNEFKDICYGYDKHKPDLNFISVQHVKNVNLPDDVFEPGEAKPARPPKRPGAALNGPKKRPAPSDVTQAPPIKRHQESSQASLAAAG